MGWLNPFSWFPEDPKTRCGWRALTIYRNPKKDPYYFFCEWDDRATSEGSFESSFVTLERHIQAGVDQLSLIQSRYSPGTWDYWLGDFYKSVWPKVVRLFWEGKQ